MRILYRLEEGFLALLLAFMVIITFAQVVMRYAFGSGLLWAQEATLYAFAWLVVFGLAYGIRTRAHLGIDLVVKCLRARARRDGGALAIAACILYAALMAYGAYIYVEKLHWSASRRKTFPLERWMLSSIMPIGFGLLGLRLVSRRGASCAARLRASSSPTRRSDALADAQIHGPAQPVAVRASWHDQPRSCSCCCSR